MNVYGTVLIGITGRGECVCVCVNGCILGVRLWGSKDGNGHLEEGGWRKSVIAGGRRTSVKITDQISIKTKTDKDERGTLHHVLC